MGSNKCDSTYPIKRDKKRLNIIVDKRNKIAWSYINQSFPDKRWPINEQIVTDAIDFLELLGFNIYTIVN